MDTGSGMVDTSPPRERQKCEHTGFGTLTKYDVFLNHRGPDLKFTFVSHLSKALRQAGLDPFLDAKALWKGQPAFGSINEALSGVHVHIAIFSPRYAESKYCLNELCDMLASGKPIIPVFYDVGPELLRRTDIEPFAGAFRKHLERGRDEDVVRWKGALLQASAITGIRLADCNNDTVELEEEIVAAVLKVLPAQAATIARQIQQAQQQRLPEQGQQLPKYDVFLNYGGPDLKKTFVAHLHKALCQAGRNPFLDVKALMKGHHALHSINQALGEVHVHIAIFSSMYAESKYCLDELCDMLASQKPVIPVFYDVEPANLRWTDIGPFAGAFRKHLERGRDEDVVRWKGALLQASAITGIRLADCNNDTVELEEEIVAAVLKVLPAQAATTGSKIQQVEQQWLPQQEQRRFLKIAKECVEEVEKMPLPNFNDVQCAYLVDRLKVVIKSASLFLETEAHRPGSFVDAARHVETFKLLLALANQIESFVRGCCQDAWIQAAMTWTNVAEHVSSIVSNLELCKMAFSQQSAATESLSLDQIVDIINAEIEIVKKKASIDVETLLARVTLELNSLKSGERDLASFLLQRLLRVQANHPSLTLASSSLGVNDDESIWGRLFHWVNPAERLGKGSAATVHKATWLGMQVAKKTFQGHENPDFMQEVGILGKLCHPNITSMFCCAKHKRWCAIIMELMDEDLHDLMQRRCNENNCSYPFSILEALDIMLQIGEGVNYLHSQKIVHRDLKSFNILVKTVKARGVEVEYVHAKVADFGLSKTKQSSIRYSSQTFNTGTNRWMAPEIINLNVGAQAGPLEPKYPFKCDVYSFAMVCYEILTGYEPFFEEMSLSNIKEKVLKGVRPSLPDYCPPSLKALIEQCWIQEPKERPSFTSICSRLMYLKYLLMTDTMQTSDASTSSQAKVGSVAGNPSTLGYTINSLTQSHRMSGPTTLEPIVNGGPAGLFGSSEKAKKREPLEYSGQGTILSGTGSASTGSDYMAGVGLNPLQERPQKALKISYRAKFGINAGVISAIPPTPGLAQPVQTGTIASTTSAASLPPQLPSGGLTYTKLWEGILAGQRQQKSVLICKLEGYRNTLASEKLAADWPSTLQIVRAVSRDYMNLNEFPENSERLVFRLLSQHKFLGEFDEKNLCAVVQLPSQILLLAAFDKPSQLFGMLIPGGMDVLKDLQLTSTLQPMGQTLD